MNIFFQIFLNSLLLVNSLLWSYSFFIFTNVNMNLQALNNWGLALQVCLIVFHLYFFDREYLIYINHCLCNKMMSFSTAPFMHVLSGYLLSLSCALIYISGTECHCSCSWETDYSQNCYRQGMWFMHLIKGLGNLTEPMDRNYFCCDNLTPLFIYSSVQQYSCSLISTGQFTILELYWLVWLQSCSLIIVWHIIAKDEFDILV